MKNIQTFPVPSIPVEGRTLKHQILTMIYPRSCAQGTLQQAQGSWHQRHCGQLQLEQWQWQPQRQETKVAMAAYLKEGRINNHAAPAQL